MGEGGDQRETLTIVVPAFDEERRLPALLAGLERRGGRFRTVRFEQNRGKGAAVKAGLLDAKADVALVTDVDLSAPLGELRVLSAALRTGADLALGSRALPDSRILKRQRRSRETMGKAFNLALRMLTGLPFRDTQCGFKLFRLAAARPVVGALRIDGFAFDAELCLRACRAGLRVVEVPVEWANHPDTRVGSRGAARMAVDLLRLAWWSRGPLPR